MSNKNARRRFCLIAATGIPLLAACAREDRTVTLEEMLQGPGPQTPQEQLASFQLEPGFHLELAAAEPQVLDPIDIAWDERGRMYVAEYRDYPLRPAEGERPLSRIRVLQDLTGDGYYETSTVFAEGIHWVSSIAPWRGGVYVTAPPHILYLKDTTGDGVADFQETVFTGFGTGSSEEIVNNLKFGLDGWIYGTSSHNAGEIRTVNGPGSTVSLRGRDFRFHPDTRVFEPVSGGGGDYGNSFDDWGNRFVTIPGGNPFVHVVLGAHYLARNPYFAPERVRERIADLPDFRVYQISPPEPWRVARRQLWDRFVDTSHDMRRERFSERELADGGYVTGTAGGTIYRGSTYPAAYQGTAFIAECAGNLVLQLAMHPRGATFTAPRRHSEDREFLASTDNWFRPVNFANGPDGNLYIVDMYREYIEYPSAIPDEILQYLDLYSGSDRGRIWRLVHESQVSRAQPRFATTEDLLIALTSADSWPRETAQRLLMEHNERTAVPAIQRLAIGHELPQVRVQALWTLQTLESLDHATVIHALGDFHPRVRENAIRLAETFPSAARELWRVVAERADDSDPRVRFQAALTLGGWQDAEAMRPLARLASRDADDFWIRNALLTARPAVVSELFLALSAEETFHGVVFLADLLRVVGATGDQRAIGAALARLAERDEAHRDASVSLLRALAEGVSTSDASLHLLRRSGSPAARAFYERTIDRAVAVARDPSLSVEVRTDAAQLLGFTGDARTAGLAPLLDPTQPEPVQRAVVAALARMGETTGGEALVAAWRRSAPAIREELLEALVRRPEYVNTLLAAVEDGTIATAEIPADRRQALLSHSNTDIRTRASSLFGATDPDRAQVIAHYQQVLASLTGDSERGRTVYERSCAMCHAFQGIGDEVGPNLNEWTGRPPEALLVYILDPNRNVSPQYVTYVVTTRDGETFSGIIASETEAAVTLRMPGGRSHQILRANIGQLTSMQRSLMPEGLEAGITEQQMADLLKFIKQPR